MANEQNPVLNSTISCRYGGDGIERCQRIADQIKCPLHLAVPQAPADVLNRIGEAGGFSAVFVCNVRPAFHGLGDMLDAHRQMEPCVETPAVQLGHAHKQCWIRNGTALILAGGRFSLARLGAHAIRSPVATRGDAAVEYSLGTLWDMRLDLGGGDSRRHGVAINYLFGTGRRVAQVRAAGRAVPRQPESDRGKNRRGMERAYCRGGGRAARAGDSGYDRSAGADHGAAPPRARADRAWQ